MSWIGGIFKCCGYGKVLCNSGAGPAPFIGDDEEEARPIPPCTCESLRPDPDSAC